MSVPTQAVKLVEQFKEELQAVKSSNFKEDWVRRDYIDPFFKALGWDVDYERRGSKFFREVVVEATLKVDGAMKAPDYAFRTEGATKFFVEAKKPSVNLLDGRAAAFQVRRYAWSAKLPLSILTDFEELAVYDCHFRPVKEDKASTARNLYMTYEEYPDRWDEIASLFSKEAVLSGSLDAYAQNLKKKRGVDTVDEAFLKEMERWREMLAKDLAKRNPSLKRRELNYAVQMTIDRIVFLRICEDRGIEDYGKLEDLVGKDNVYGRLCDAFKDADDKYNSGLFHFRQEKGRDELTLKLQLSDQPLKKIIKGLYYPESPYQFSVMPVEIMGQVYEQFLGKVISVTPAHRVVIEEKPEVRKAGGVYYTPSYIVDYIVENTVGKLLEGKTPQQASKLRILDPACGSGSFLIGAYTYLLDWHRRWYVNDGADKHAKVLYQGPSGEWQLTTAKKKDILLNNLYGVDIDPQAVEVTKLSLLLKVLEGETNESINSQLTFFNERALPDLDNNIKWGNSLIGPDFYNDDQMMLLDEDAHYRINVFGWKTNFPQVFTGNNPGFDAVVGNPPYIRIQALKEFAPVEVEHYKKTYRCAGKGNYDIYVVFIERGLELLNKNGKLGYILPHKFFNAKYGQPIRQLISEGRHLSEVVHFGDEQVFAGATTYIALLFLDRSGKEEFRFAKVDDLINWRVNRSVTEGAVPATSVTASEWNFVVGKGAVLFDKLQSMPVKLGDIASMSVGLQTSADTVYLFKKFRAGGSNTTQVLSQELSEWTTLESDILRSVVRSGSIGRYMVMPTALVLFPYAVEDSTARLFSQEELERNYPLAWEYLNRNKKLLEDREKGKFKDGSWYRFGRTQNLGVWEQPKIMVPYMITRLAAYPDRHHNYYFINVTTGGYGIFLDETFGSMVFVCGLLNSRLLDYYFKQVSSNFNSGYFAANKQYIEQLPIRTINFSDPDDVARHDKMVELVERMLSLHERLLTAKLNQEKTIIQHQIDATDRQIDRLVYELYELTEDEIEIVEG